MAEVELLARAAARARGQGVFGTRRRGSGRQSLVWPRDPGDAPTVTSTPPLLLERGDAWAAEGGGKGVCPE